MATLTLNNAIDGLSVGGTVTVSAQNGVLAGDTDPFGYYLEVAAVGTATQTANVTGGTATIQGIRSQSAPTGATATHWVRLLANHALQTTCRSGLCRGSLQLGRQGRGVVGFCHAGGAAESFRQVGGAVSRHEDEGDSVRRQIVGQGIHHLAVQIRVQNRHIDRLPTASLGGRASALVAVFPAAMNSPSPVLSILVSPPTKISVDPEI
jgi:hypothetical protein